jgi:hypothetical protein
VHLSDEIDIFFEAGQDKRVFHVPEVAEQDDFFISQSSARKNLAIAGFACTMIARGGSN